MAVPSALIVDGVRTPFGSHNSKLSSWHAVDLLSAAFVGVVERSGIAITDIDCVIAGCAVPVGEQAMNVTRSAVLAAGWSESLPAHTIDAQGASGVVALHQAVARVQSGMANVCLVGAVSSTRVPDGASTGVAVGKPFGSSVHDRYAEQGGLRSPGVMAEHLANRLGISRSDLDAYASQSIERARQAEETGQNKSFLLEIRDHKKTPTVVTTDEFPRKRDITKLQPLFEKDGLLTAATFALPVSGAVALIVANAKVLPKRSRPLAEVLTCVESGGDVLLGASGVEIANRAIEYLQDTPTFVEVLEDSAVTPVAFTAESRFDPSVINRHGGSLAIGDAFGVSSLAAIVHAAHALDPDNPVGLSVSAGANGISTATVVKVHNP